MPPSCRETSVSRTANVGTVGMNGLSMRRRALNPPKLNEFQSDCIHNLIRNQMESRLVLNQTEKFELNHIQLNLT